MLANNIICKYTQTNKLLLVDFYKLDIYR